jgi:hypothetical protein
MTGGFGKIGNTSGRGLGIFQGHLYVGTQNFDVGVQGSSEGAEVWRAPVEGAGDASNWERVYGGNPDVAWLSDFTVFQGALYASNCWAPPLWYLADGAKERLAELRAGTGGMRGLFRTEDGKNWEPALADVREWGTKASGVQSMTVFKGRLFAGTANGTERRFDMFVTEDGREWKRVGTQGFGTEGNIGVRAIGEYNGRLYFGTGRLAQGFWSGSRLWSSADGDEWVEEFDTELWGHFGTRSLAVHDGKLYIGTQSFLDGAIVIEAEARMP